MELKKISKDDKKRAYLRSLMTFFDIKYGEMAVSLGVTQAYISRIMHGVDPDVKKRIRPMIGAYILGKIAEQHPSEKYGVRMRRRIAVALSLREEEIPRYKHTGKAA